MEQIELIAEEPRAVSAETPAEKRKRLRAAAKARGLCGSCHGRPRSGERASCDVCIAKTKKWREANPEKHRESNKVYRKRHPQRVRATMNKWRAENPEAQTRNADIANLRVKMRKHGADVDEYQAMLSAQDGKCAICGSADPKNKRAKRLYVDHCHASGVIRGLLCRPCNSVLGFVGDSVELLRASIAYLEKSK